MKASWIQNIDVKKFLYKVTFSDVNKTLDLPTSDGVDSDISISKIPYPEITGSEIIIESHFNESKLIAPPEVPSSEDNNSVVLKPEIPTSEAAAFGAYSTDVSNSVVPISGVPTSKVPVAA